MDREEVNEEKVCNDQGCRIQPIVQRGGGYLEPTSTYGVPLGRTLGRTIGRARRSTGRRRRRPASVVQRGAGRRRRRVTRKRRGAPKRRPRTGRRRNGRRSQTDFF